MLTAKVVDGQLDVPKGLLEEGTIVTLLVPETPGVFDLSDEESAFLRDSLAQIARGEWVDGDELIESRCDRDPGALAYEPRRYP
jgi:hypothetical protein